MNDVRPLPGGDENPREHMYRKYVLSGTSGVRAETIKDLAPRVPYLRRIVRNFFPANKQAAILDLGCGNGALLHVLAQGGYCNLSGVDASAEQVEVAHALGVRGVKQSDLFSCLREARSATFDVVITFDVIEHLSKQEVMLAAGEVHRVLGPDGRWLIQWTEW